MQEEADAAAVLAPQQVQDGSQDIPRHVRELPAQLPDRNGDQEVVENSFPPLPEEATTEVEFFCFDWFWKIFM